MSRAYRATWVTVSCGVTSSDTLVMKLSLMGILQEGEMAALLRDELERAGWTRRADGAMSGTIDGLQATLDAEASEISLSVAGESEVKARGTSDGDAMANLDRVKAMEEEAMKRSLAQQLTAAEPTLRGKVGEVIQRVYLQALRRKAASMGTVESVHEGTDARGEYEVTIKVRV